jgi:hypothetical protein
MKRGGGGCGVNCIVYRCTFWALMLACAAADVAPREEYAYTPVPGMKRRSFRGF